MRGTSRAAVLAVVLLALIPHPASAQVEKYLGRPITDVRLEIAGQPTSEVELQDILETRRGDPLTAAQVRESIIHLMALSRFEDVQVSADLSPGGVVLTYQLRPLRPVRSIEFRGRLGLPEDRLRSEITDRYGNSPALSRTSDIRDALLALYHAHGYMEAGITPRPQLGATEATLAFDIEAGAQARIARLDVEKDAGLDQANLLARLRLRVGEAYDPADLAARVSAYTDSLRAKGFYQASIQVSPTAPADAVPINLVVTAQRGPRVSVQLAGDPVPGARLDDLVPIKRENSVDQDLIEDWSSNIERQLRLEGYRDAKVTPEQRKAPGQLTIVFDAKRGPRYVIDDVVAAGNQLMPTPRVLEALAADPLRVTKGQPYAERTVDAALRKLENLYRGKGFTAVAAKQAITTRRAPSQVFVTLTVNISEGQQTLVDAVTFVGNQRVSSADLGAVIKTRPGMAFVSGTLEEDRQALLVDYLNRGFQQATVSLPDTKEMMSRDRSQAVVRFLIREGPQVFVDHILLVGNSHTKASTIRNALDITPGQPLSLSRLTESQRRLAALGLFRRVQVTPMPQGSETMRDVLVIVQEAPATTLAYGGGLGGGKRQRVDANGNPVEAIELEPRAVFDIGRRNLWGKNRSVNFNGSFALRPQFTGVVGAGLREYRALGTYREPRVFGSAADLLITGGVEQAVRPAYSFNRRGLRAEVSRRLPKNLTFYARYALDRTRLINPPQSIDLQILLGRILPGVRLSKVSTSLVRDTRDDPLDPSSGVLASVDGEIAPPLMGSEIGVVKGIGQGFFYHQLPGPRRIVLAAGIRMGVASGYGTTELKDAEGNPVLDSRGNAVTVPVTSPPLSERFFAGGNTTVRGVAEDTLGTPATLVNGFATGGGGLLLLNGELRVSVWKSLAAVGFVDAGNVYELASKIQPTDLQPAVGFGFRYKSPIGPIRVDVGFNLNRRVLGTQREGLTVISFGIGQAF